MGLDQTFVNEIGPNSVVVKVPEGAREGGELLEKILKENPGIEVTPRWPMKLGASSRKYRVEVSSTKEAIRLVDRKGNKNEKRYVVIGGKQCEVEAYDPRKGLSPTGVALDASAYIPKGPKAALHTPRAPGGRAAAPAQGMGSFAAVAGAANAGDAQGEGWKTAGRSKNVGGTCRKCARTGHLERACLVRVQTQKFTCHRCGQLGHFILACPTRAMGTGIFAPQGCFNCGKHDHQDE